MSNYPRPILDYWRKAFEGTVVEIGADLTLSVVHTLSRKRPAMMLEGADGSVQAAITPELATVIDHETTGASATALRERLTNEGIAFHDPDFLFYLSADAAAEAGHSAPARRLTEDDRAVFDAFYATASEQDREDSYVELDQWAVFGCFEGEQLVSAASAILWDDSPVADLGVLTLPDARGKGYARAAVGSLSGFARQQGYEPQYRCQMDNQASVALAKACGFGLFGKWIVASGE